MRADLGACTTSEENSYGAQQHSHSKGTPVGVCVITQHPRARARTRARPPSGRNHGGAEAWTLCDHSTPSSHASAVHAPSPLLGRGSSRRSLRAARSSRQTPCGPCRVPRQGSYVSTTTTTPTTTTTNGRSAAQARACGWRRSGLAVARTAALARTRRRRRRRRAHRPVARRPTRARRRPAPTALRPPTTRETTRVNSLVDVFLLLFENRNALALHSKLAGEKGSEKGLPRPLRGLSNKGLVNMDLAYIHDHMRHVR